MNFPRRHHNAVLLPDGTVLVVGGTRGGNGARPAKGVTGFNDLGAGQPVHFAEMWDPRGNNGGGAWELLAAEETDRGYHSTAVLLPDARVLSAGSGEYRPDDVHASPQKTTTAKRRSSRRHTFRGPRPVITSAPAAVDYGETFDVTVSTAHGIGKVTWIRLPSVTHAFDQSQRINILGFVKDSDPLKVTAPERPEVCPRGTTCCSFSTKPGYRPRRRSFRSPPPRKPHRTPRAPNIGWRWSPGDGRACCDGGCRGLHIRVTVAAAGNRGDRRHRRYVSVRNRCLLGRCA